MAKSEFTVTQSWTTNLKNPQRWIASHVLRNKGLLAIIVIGAAGNAALASVLPVLIGIAFDRVTGDVPSLRPLWWIIGLIVISQLVRSVLQFGRNFGSEVVGQRLERDARQELYASLLGKNMDFHDSYATGDIMARATNDMRELALMMAPGLNLVLGSANFLIMPLLVSPAIHPALILTPALFAVGYAISMYFYLRELQPATAEVRSTFGILNGGLTEAVEGIETVKGAAQEDHEIERFDHSVRNWREAFVHQGRIEARFLPLLLFGLAQGFALWHALYLYGQNALTVGEVVSYMGIISLFGFPTFVSLFAYSQAASGYSSARRILELIQRESRLDQNEAGHVGKMQGAVRFDNVSFTYTTQTESEFFDTDHGSNGFHPEEFHPALEDVSFDLGVGQTLALVGQTGAGKSTVAKLLNRIYDADAGQVLIDDIDVSQWNIGSLRSQISIIEQDIFLFSRTVAENIAFGKPDATQAEIEEAAAKAQAHDFITGFPDGYQTVIGERGVMLSGGQRQRLALARAFLTDPAILILDDSTSAIDSATEDKIQRAIQAATEGRTTILITHRLSQIRWADKIVVLRNGHVAAVGTHEDLLEQSEAYQNIFARL